MIDFNELVDNYLKKEPKPKEIGKYYPSEVGGCIRKIWFSYKKPKQKDKDTLKIFEAGNRMHDFISEVIKSEKNPHVELVEKEMPFKLPFDDFIISGRIDDLILLKIDNKEYLVEVKSTKYLPKEPNKAHISQLQFYMHARKIENGILLYIQKDNLQTKWFDITYDKAQAEEIIERFKKLHSSLVKNEIPEAEAKQGGETLWMCDYCEYKDECDEL
jgi:hypothetical protein